jgi:hypothetical protein
MHAVRSSASRAVAAFAPLSVVLLTLISTACAARVTQFHDFATAGVSYQRASDAVLDDAGTAAIRADNAVLVRARPDIPTSKQRQTDVLQHNRDLQKRMAVLRDLRRHGRVLQRYFQALAAIAESKAPEAAAAAAGQTFTALSSLSTTLKSSQAGAVVPPLTKLVVGSFKVRALENELKQRADAIAAEIKLQEVLFKIVGDTLRTDLRVQLNTMETGQVIAPFAADATLPSSWGTTRETFLKASASAESADAAARAAAAMQEAFTALVQNRFDHAAFNSLLDDIAEVLSIAEQLAPASGEE